jgi:uncharacterized membrane protein YuzA (DUF378 family)
VNNKFTFCAIYPQEEIMKNFMKGLNVTAFTILLIGGLNYLFMGLFGLDLFTGLFGAEMGIIGRIFYFIIGLSALLLLLTVIARSIMNDKRERESK